MEASFIHCLCLVSRLDDVPARQALASARRHRLPGSRRPHWAQLSGTFGHSWIGFASFDYVASFSLICDVALGFIAFSIGNEFRLSALKHTGKQATVIAIIQALAATILVDITLLLLHLVLGDKLPVSTCIVLGAVATATAPCRHHYGGKPIQSQGAAYESAPAHCGPDDAVGLVVFAISFGVAKTMISGSLQPLVRGAQSLAGDCLLLGLGSILGGLFSLVEKLFHSNSKRLSIAVTFVILATALSKVQIPLGGEISIGFSPLLVCMMVGTVFCNVCDFSEEIMFKTDRWTAPLYVSSSCLVARSWICGCSGSWPWLVSGLPIFCPGLLANCRRLPPQPS